MPLIEPIPDIPELDLPSVDEGAGVTAANEDVAADKHAFARFINEMIGIINGLPSIQLNRAILAEREAFEAMRETPRDQLDIRDIKAVTDRMVSGDGAQHLGKFLRERRAAQDYFLADPYERLARLVDVYQRKYGLDTDGCAQRKKLIKQVLTGGAYDALLFTYNARQLTQVLDLLDVLIPFITARIERNESVDNADREAIKAKLAQLQLLQQDLVETGRKILAPAKGDSSDTTTSTSASTLGRSNIAISRSTLSASNDAGVTSSVIAKSFLEIQPGEDVGLYGTLQYTINGIFRGLLGEHSEKEKPVLKTLSTEDHTLYRSYVPLGAAEAITPATPLTVVEMLAGYLWFTGGDSEDSDSASSTTPTTRRTVAETLDALIAKADRQNREAAATAPTQPTTMDAISAQAGKMLVDAWGMFYGAEDDDAQADCAAAQSTLDKSLLTMSGLEREFPAVLGRVDASSDDEQAVAASGTGNGVEAAPANSGTGAEGRPVAQSRLGSDASNIFVRKEDKLPTSVETRSATILGELLKLFQKINKSSQLSSAIGELYTNLNAQIVTLEASPMKPKKRKAKFNNIQVIADAHVKMLWKINDSRLSPEQKKDAILECYQTSTQSKWTSEKFGKLCLTILCGAIGAVFGAVVGAVVTAAIVGAATGGSGAAAGAVAGLIGGAIKGASLGVGIGAGITCGGLATFGARHLFFKPTPGERRRQEKIDAVQTAAHTEVATPTKGGLFVETARTVRTVRAR
jgi:hypothetical protein